MNSLLQTLFMTPEFRRLMYSWKYDAEVNGEAKDCIPLQLQKLFGTLQLTSRRAVGTTPLTKSFQWTSSDAFRQHDVQELMRVLLDALERALRASGHPTPTAVNDLFRGVYNDYVRTASKADLEQAGEKLPEDEGASLPEGAKVHQGLATESIARSQNAEFMDLSLVIKPFGATKALGSVEESLTAFIASEVMAGSNRVQFDELGEGVRVPAVKGLKITRPPYILTLQLKRFDLDMMSPTLARIKLNDKVTFPILLNFNQWVGKEGGEVQAEADTQATTSTVQDTAAPAAAEEGDTPAAVGGTAATPMSGSGGEPVPDESAAVHPPGLDKLEDYDTFKARAHQVALQHGPYVYELYAVLVHSGSAVGGHYYVYIRDLDNGQWRNFNDSTVSDIDVETVKEAFGGARGNSLYASSASAYMLVYRRMTFEDVPVPESDDAAEADAVQAESDGAEEGGGAAAPADGVLAAAAAEFGVSRAELLSGRSAAFPPRGAVPEYVQAAMDEDVAAELQAELERNRTFNSIKLNVRYGDRVLQLPAERTLTVAQVTESAWKLLGLQDPATADTEAVIDDKPSSAEEGDVVDADGGAKPDDGGAKPDDGGAQPGEGGVDGKATGQYLPLDCVRLREYRLHNKSLGQPYDGPKAKMTISECAMYAGMHVLLETREVDGEFPEFDPQAVTIKIRKYLRSQGDFSEAATVSIRRSVSLAALKRAIETHRELGVPVEHQRVLKMSKYGTGNNMNFTLRVLSGDHLALGNAFFVGSGSELYVEDVSAGATGDDSDFNPFQDGEEKPSGKDQPAGEEKQAGVDTRVGEGGVQGVSASTPSDARASAAEAARALGVGEREAIMAQSKEGALTNYSLKEGLLAIEAGQSAAVATFKILAHRVRIRYRLLDSKTEGLPFYIDMRSTVGELRAAVGKRLEVPPERLLLDKVHESHTVGMPLKDDTVKLEHLYFMPTTVLMTREGRRLQPGQVNVKLSLYTPSHLNGSTWPSAPDVPVMESLEDGSASWVSYGGWAPRPMFPADRASIPVSGVYPDEADKADSDKAERGGVGGVQGGAEEPSTATEAELAAGKAAAGDGGEGAGGDGTAAAGADASAADDGTKGATASASAAAPQLTEDWHSSAPYPELPEMTFEALGVHPIALVDEVEAVKQTAKDLLVKGGRVSEDCSLRRLRLRQKPGLRPSRVLPDHTTVGDTYTALYEHMELQVEILPHEEEHICGRTRREQLELQATLAESAQAEGGGEGGEQPAAQAEGTATGSYASAASAGAAAPAAPEKRTTLNDVDYDDLVLVVQWLDLPRHKLCVPRELRVQKRMSVAEAVLQCAELAHVPADAVQWVLHAGGKVELWHARSQPWQLSSAHTATSSFRAKYSQDGALLLLRDSRQPRRELSEADLAVLNPYSRSYGSSGSSSRLAGALSSGARYRPREQGIKITVKGEQEAPTAVSASAVDSGGSSGGSAVQGATTASSSSTVASGAGGGAADGAVFTAVSAMVDGSAPSARLGKTEQQVAMEEAVRAQLRAEAAASGEGEEVIAYGGEGLFDMLNAFDD